MAKVWDSAEETDYSIRSWVVCVRNKLLSEAERLREAAGLEVKWKAFIFAAFSERVHGSSTGFSFVPFGDLLAFGKIPIKWAFWECKKYEKSAEGRSL